ncbi:MAG: B12-binding domain-containing protein [Chloroflexi bacterium]|nr:B12-binding domain-containing protein [Chloroflexota bacterium]
MHSAILAPMSVPWDSELDEVARASERPTYNTAAVENQTGLRPATFRAWERRYGFPRPRRLPGNQRLYSDRDVAAIRWLHRRTTEGLAISHAVQLLEDSLTAAAGGGPPNAGRSPAALADDLVRALLAFDASTAERLLSEAFALHPTEDVCLRVIEPSLVDIGERWHRGVVSVAAEHFATTFMRRKLFALLNVYETHRGRRLVFTATAPGEWHEVGILMVSLFLLRHGLGVSYLGPSLLSDGLAETLRGQRPDLLCISATCEETAEKYADIVGVVESLPPPRPELAYGGQAFADPARRATVRGTYLGSDAAAAVATIERLLNSKG